MNERRIEPMEILPDKPFPFGMATAFDLYGMSGRKMYSRIQKHWRSIMDQPRKSAEEALRDDIAAVNNEFKRLLEEQKAQCDLSKA